MLIEVTQEDIDNGDSSAYSCPINKAISKALKCSSEKVHRKMVFILPGTGYGERMIKLPHNVRMKIRHHDAGNKIKPFSFELEI